ncbi:hypothetical protein BS47DRAFT_1091098 [Hydnum rufescens UP504]|uniref:Vta1/callose synthase N-terminal domain-containing protein n=1 Tax=Hydnum rufescens UP504 TaxID=1448309 RepID=A0A9P6DV43_9AGAM|nr:hypothetical protein BS47DRAFT_1091098 [Hydnum rufescens UP504]
MVLPISQSFTLPELPQPLTHLSPYVQRALELKTKDPIMCYWCLYFSAKHGVAAKGGKECRPFLFDLMDTLEKLKQELKSNDAIATDEAGSAYIENFALKVFNLADNEDRKGKASRSTAKKFLAAANFLELLTIFDVGDQSENEEKIRYSKWKAADIAKAFREGRQPTPGPAGSSFRDMQPSASGAVSPSQQHESLSVFGSIPPSISASPIRASLLPLPSSPNSRPQPLPSPSDLTPISSPPSRTVPLHNVSPPSVSPERTTAAHNNTHDTLPILLRGVGAAPQPPETMNPGGCHRLALLKQEPQL